MNDNENSPKQILDTKTAVKTKKVLEKAINGTSKTVTSIVGGKTIQSDIEYYKAKTQVDQPSDEYKKYYKDEKKKFEKTFKSSDDEKNFENIKFQTSNDNHVENHIDTPKQALKTSDITIERHDSTVMLSDEIPQQNLKTSGSVAEKHDRETAMKGLDESGGKVLKTSIQKSEIHHDGNVNKHLIQINLLKTHGDSSHQQKIKFGLQDSKQEHIFENSQMPKTMIIDTDQETLHSDTSNNETHSENKLHTSQNNTIDYIDITSPSHTDDITGTKTGINNSEIYVLITDERGQQNKLGVGEGIFLDNGALIGFDLDASGEGYVFTNFFNNENVAGKGNILNEKSKGFIANGMTLKTSVVNEQTLSVSEVIGADGIKIITLDMENNQNVNKLATLIKSNDHTLNPKLNMTEKTANHLKAKTAVLVGSTIIVKGASFVGTKALGITSTLFEGMGSDKSEAEFTSDKIMEIGRKQSQKVLKKGGNIVLNSKPVTVIKQESKQVIVRIGNKIGFALKNQMLKYPVTSKIYKIGSVAGKKLGKVGTVIKKVGRALKFASVSIKKFLIIIIAMILVMSLIICAGGAVINGITSIFGFLFPESESQTLYEKYGNYVIEINGYIDNMNNQFNNNHILPIYNIVIDSENVNSQLVNKDYAELSENVTKRIDGTIGNDSKNFEYGKEYFIIDDKGNKVVAQSIADESIYTGQINGVNWRAFLSCTQIYSGLTNDLTEISNNESTGKFSALDPDNPRPYLQFKNNWNGNNSTSEFVKPFVTVDVKCYYIDDNGNIKENDINSFNDAGDKWYEDCLKSREGYFEHKALIEEYNERKSEYDKDQAEWKKRKKTMSTEEVFESQLQAHVNDEKWIEKYGTYKKYLAAIESGGLYGPKVEKPTKPVCNNLDHKADYSKMCEELKKDPPSNIYHHYKMTFQMADESDQSLDRYSSWFSYNMYEQQEDGTSRMRVLDEDEQEMLQRLYSSSMLFDGFSEEMSNILNVSPGGIITPLNITITGDSELGVKIAKIAASRGGARYWWGRSGPNYFDCSGLVYYCLKEAGVNISRSTANVYGHSGVEITISELQAGDVIAIGMNDSDYTHIGIYAGNNKVIHAGGGDENTHGQDPDAYVKITTLDSFINGTRKAYSFRRLY